MTSSDFPYEGQLTILASDKEKYDEWPEDWKASYHKFIEELEQVPDLRTKKPKTDSSGAKGGFELLNDIIVYAVSINAFSAIYVLMKDLVFNVSVTLIFPDGHKIIINNLTLAKANKIIQEHEGKEGRTDNRPKLVLPSGELIFFNDINEAMSELPKYIN